MFYSIEILPNPQLTKNMPISQKFLEMGIDYLKDAVKYVHSLPYGRTSDRTDLLLVIDEESGDSSRLYQALVIK